MVVAWGFYVTKIVLVWIELGSICFQVFLTFFFQGYCYPCYSENELKVDRDSGTCLSQWALRRSFLSCLLQTQGKGGRWGRKEGRMGKSSIDSGPFDIGREMSVFWVAGDMWGYLGWWDRQQNHSLRNSGMENGLNHCSALDCLREVFLIQLIMFVTWDSDNRSWDDEFQLSDPLPRWVF